MTKEQANLIIEMVDADWVEDNVYAASEMLNELAREYLYLTDDVQLLTEQIRPYHDLTDKLYKDNKKLKNKLSKYEK